MELFFIGVAIGLGAFLIVWNQVFKPRYEKYFTNWELADKAVHQLAAENEELKKKLEKPGIRASNSIIGLRTRT